MALAACVGLGLAATALAVDHPETEANDNKAAANAVTMACGDTISGFTTGASTTVAGDGSADYFLITTPMTTPGIYKYTLTLTSATPGHTATIRGLNQSVGVPGTTDSTMQTGVTVGSDRVNVFYGFGTGGQIYYRVTGTASTTGTYTVTLTCEPVSPIVIPGFVMPGSIGIVPDSATATALDTDWWVYDQNFSALPDFGHDDADETVITRSLSPGNYYIAMGNYNSCNNLGSPADDTFRSGIVLDFPGVHANSTTGALTTMNITVRDGSTVLTGTGSRANPFEIAWYRFSVVVPDFPTAMLSQSPNPVVRGSAVTLTLNITAAPGSSLDNITSVTANVSAVSGNPGDTSVTFTRAFPGSSDWTYSIMAADGAVGTQPVSFTIVDPMSPGGNGNGNASVVISAPPAANDTCQTATVITSVPYTDAVVASTATNDIDVSCNATGNTELRFGVWYTYTTGADPGRITLGESGPHDVVIAAFAGGCDSLTEVACYDSEVGTSFDALPNTTYHFAVGMWSTTTVPTGNHQITVNFTAVTGACCAGNGDCTLTPLSQCSGTWQGANTTCGGADAYYFVNSSESFEDIAAIGTIAATASNCDDCGETVTLPFTFTFLGTPYTSVWVCSNGFIQFGGANNATFTNALIPATGVPNNFIAPLWDDLNTITGGDIYTYSDGPPGSQRFIVSWQNVAQHLNSDSNTFQVILYEGTNRFEFRYGSITFETPVNDYTIGYENAGGTAGASIPGAEIGSGNTARLGTNANPCPQGSTGACCRGATCEVSTAAACTGFASAFSGTGTVCNVFATNNLSPCCLADFNHVGGIGIQDIFDFLAAYFAGCN